jgi:hypothetical protein
MPLFWCYYFADWYEFTLHTVILLEGCMGGADVKGSGGILALELH